MRHKGGCLTTIRKYQEPDGRLRYLSGEAETERLLQACEDWFRPIVLTAPHTWMRKGEILGLTWDMTHGFIQLKQTENGKARRCPSAKPCGGCSVVYKLGSMFRGSFTIKQNIGGRM
ncbi:MAG: hypothetical protein KF693_19330 [Nitrospira sp.]|nr:hypothetical protein [Nitrospira sp.]